MLSRLDVVDNTVDVQIVYNTLSASEIHLVITIVVSVLNREFRARLWFGVLFLVLLGLMSNLILLLPLELMWGSLEGLRLTSFNQSGDITHFIHMMYSKVRNLKTPSISLLFHIILRFPLFHREVHAGNRERD